MMSEGQRQVLIQYAIKFKSARNIYGSDIHEIRSLADFALAALTQPAGPALRLPDGWRLVPDEPTEEMIIGFWGEIKHGQPELDAAKEAYADMLAAVPHTAPIEPICATGGAEWVKCSERMPLELSDEHISEVEVIVTDGNKVGTCECRRGYMPCPWVEWSNYGDIDAEKITHWMPLPAAPEEE